MRRIGNAASCLLIGLLTAPTAALADGRLMLSWTGTVTAIENRDGEPALTALETGDRITGSLTVWPEAHASERRTSGSTPSHELMYERGARIRTEAEGYDWSARGLRAAVSYWQWTGSVICVGTCEPPPDPYTTLSFLARTFDGHSATSFPELREQFHIEIYFRSSGWSTPLSAYPDDIDQLDFDSVFEAVGSLSTWNTYSDPADANGYTVHFSIDSVEASAPSQNGSGAVLNIIQTLITN